MWSSVIILLLCFSVWAVAHSVLAGRRFKHWLGARLGERFMLRYYRLAYSIFAGVTLLPVGALLLLLPDRRLYLAPAPWFWMLIGIQMLALAGMVVSLWKTGIFHLMGITQLFASRPAEHGALQMDGVYRCVRHPLYFFSIVLIWFTPFMTLNWLAVALVATVYFVFGSMHEETLLLREHGAAYAAYQRRVPRLIPRPAQCFAMRHNRPAAG